MSHKSKKGNRVMTRDNEYYSTSSSSDSESSRHYGRQYGTKNKLKKTIQRNDKFSAGNVPTPNLISDEKSNFILSFSKSMHGGLIDWIELRLRNPNAIISHDFSGCLNDVKSDLINYISIQYHKLDHIDNTKYTMKVNFACDVFVEKEAQDSVQIEKYTLNGKTPLVIMDDYSIPKQIDDMLEKMQVIFDQSSFKGSGFVFKSFDKFKLTFTRAGLEFGTLAKDRSHKSNKRKQGMVAKYIPLPATKGESHSNYTYIINPQNKDEKCFEWCLLIYHLQDKIPKNKARVSQYKTLLKKSPELDPNLQWRGEVNNKSKIIKFPFNENELDLFETLNPNYSINVYSMDKIGSEYGVPIFNKSPIRTYTGEQRKYEVDLIKLTDNNDNYHYALITNFSAFMREKQHEKRFYCRKDLTGFPSAAELKNHHDNFCSNRNVKLTFPSEDKNELEFCKFHTQLPTPKYIVADLESFNKKMIGFCLICDNEKTILDVLKKNDKLPHDKFIICYQCEKHFTHSIDEETEQVTFYFRDKLYEFPDKVPEVKVKKTINLCEQRANSWAFYVVDTFNSENNRPVELDCVEDENDYDSLGQRFIAKLSDTVTELMAEIEGANAEMIITEEDQKEIDKTTHCWICKYPLFEYYKLGEMTNKKGEKRVVDQQWWLDIKNHASKNDWNQFVNYSTEYKTFMRENKLPDDYFLNKDGKEDVNTLDSVELGERNILEQKRKKVYWDWKNNKYSIHTVKDHCHFTGKFRGLAHNSCNLHFNYHNKFKVPIFFHNMRGYDSHFILQWLQSSKYINLEKLHVIPMNTEKLITFSINKMKFVDSFGFFGSSLESLVNGLMGRNESLDKEYNELLKTRNKLINNDQIKLVLDEELQKLKVKKDKIEKEGINNFEFLKQEFKRDLGLTVLPGYEEEALQLLVEKGSWPYEYFSERKQLDETCLPPKEAYDLKVAMINDKWEYKSISDEDYWKEQRKWELFNMKTLKDAHDLYLKLDILLLACVLEARRKKMLETYKQDYMWSVSLPGYAWDVLLATGFYSPERKRREHIRLEVFHENQSDMYNMIEKGIRGGICQIPHRLAKADNKYLYPQDWLKNKGWNPLPEPFHPLEKKSDEYEAIQQPRDSSYLWYVDANQLYSYAMMQYLPYKDFKWTTLDKLFPKIKDLTDMEEVTKAILKLPNNVLKGFIFTVDLEYPSKIHDKHSDYPLAPEPRIIDQKDLSEFSKNVQKQCKLHPIKTQKLYCTLYDKTDYIVHYKNLKFYLKHGLKLKAVKNILQFEQQPWIKTFIENNVEMRKNAKTDFDKDLYKLMCNAVYGKTMECETNRIEFELVPFDGINGKHGRRFQSLVRSPFYENIIPVSHNNDLVGVLSKNHKAPLTKPKATGFAVLDLSKELMYRFYYEGLRKQYSHEQTKLCMTDTDSLELLIKTDDLYQDLLDPTCKLTEFLDFSNYSLPIKVGINIIDYNWLARYFDYQGLLHDQLIAHRAKSIIYSADQLPDKLIWSIANITDSDFKLINKQLPRPTRESNYVFPPTVLLNGMNPDYNKVTGQFKDESGGLLLLEFAGNKSKSYSNLNEQFINVKKLKGIPKAVLAKCITHEHYVKTIREPFKITQLTFPKLGSQKHSMYQYSKSMIALCTFDDKRFVENNNINTKAFGHYLNSNSSDTNIPMSTIKEEPENTEVIIPMETDEKIVVKTEYGTDIKDGDDNDLIYNQSTPTRTTVTNVNNINNDNKIWQGCINCDYDWMTNTLNPINPVTKICYLCETATVLRSYSK